MAKNKIELVSLEDFRKLETDLNDAKKLADTHYNGLVEAQKKHNDAKRQVEALEQLIVQDKTVYVSVINALQETIIGMVRSNVERN